MRERDCSYARMLKWQCAPVKKKCVWNSGYLPLEHFKFYRSRERSVAGPGTSSPQPSPPFRMEERVSGGRRGGHTSTSIPRL
jgi:hypothetical protein